MQLDRTVETLRTERDRFVAFSFASADILVELDEFGTVIFVDGAISGLLGKKNDDLLGTNFVSHVHPQDTKRAEGLLDVELRENRIDHEKIQLSTKFGDALPFALSGYKLGALKNHYFLTLTYLKDQIQPKDIERREKGTGLFKKESFAEAATKMIRDAHEKGRHVNVTLVDMPELKALLDHMSKDAAQELLYEINMYLRHSSLGGDSAGIVDSGAYGLILDPDVKPEQVMDKLFEITRRFDPQGVGIQPRAETINADIPNLTEQDIANALLYTINIFAEDHGEDFRISSLSDGYETMLQDTVRKISDFKNTVEGGKFQLAFQPIVDLKNGITHHYEALVRFEGESVFENPFSFIRFGEQAGVIGDFDLSMCQRAVDTIMDARLKGHLPIVAVNLSGKSLSSNLYLDALRRIVRQHNNINKQLIFEITESAKITDFDVANDFLQELRANGFLCCLDDFGVGESSFHYLRSLQVDFVKIDGSYVRESVATKRGQHLLKAMSSMCKELGIVTIGEMVEDESVAHLLFDSGVKFGQGYFFGKPTVDTSTLEKCAQQIPHYAGIVRAKSFKEKDMYAWKPRQKPN